MYFYKDDEVDMLLDKVNFVSIFITIIIGNRCVKEN